MINDKLKFERINDMPKLKQEIILYLFDYISRKQPDRWWQFRGDFRYEDETYKLECECRADNEMFTYRHMFIEHKQKLIDIDEMISKGYLQ